MDGIQNFLSFINDNWTSIVVSIGLAIAIFEKAKGYFSKSTEEKIDIAKTQIRERVLKMITEAEVDFAEWKQAGSIKRSQVIGEIFENYPILSKLEGQEDIIRWIDNEIDNSLVILRKIVESNGGK